MTKQTGSHEGKIPRLNTFMGLTIACLSGLALVFGIAAPGLGWAISVSILLLATALAKIIRARWLTASIAISIVHLLAFGPLANFELQPGVSATFAFWIIILPLTVAAVAVWAVMKKRPKKRPTDKAKIGHS